MPFVLFVPFVPILCPYVPDVLFYTVLCQVVPLGAVVCRFVPLAGMFWGPLYFHVRITNLVFSQVVEQGKRREGRISTTALVLVIEKRYRILWYYSLKVVNMVCSICNQSILILMSVLNCSL